VRRLWPVARVAERFHVLPSAVAKSLNSDPARIDLVCFGLLEYADALAAFRRANPAELKAWRGSPLMEAVTLNDMPRPEDL
jgi:hypothetical protein